MSYDVRFWNDGEGQHQVTAPMLLDEALEVAQEHLDQCEKRDACYYDHAQYVSLELACFEPFVEHDSDGYRKFSLKPTPEWQRIQEQLSKVEQLEKERDRFRRSAGRWRELAYRKKHEFNDLKSEHESLLSRFPKNADGDVPTIDSTQFMIDDEGDILEFVVESMHKESGEIYAHGHVVGETFGVVTPTLDMCFSSYESCQSAQTEGENK